MTAAATYQNLFKKRVEGPYSKAQAMAWEKFLELGIPTKKNDSYRYLRLSHLEEEFLGASSHSITSHSSDSATLVFVNGKYREDLSNQTPLPKEIIILPLTKAWKTFGNFLQGRFLEGLRSETDPYAALNGALFDEGAFIYVPPHTTCEIPLRILRLNDAESGFFVPRLHLCLGKHAQLKVYLHDAFQEKHLTNSMIDIVLEENASLSLVSLISGGNETLHLEAVRAHLKRSSTFNSILVTNGAKTFRYDGKISLTGEGAEASLKGITQVKEKREAHFNLRMEHLAPHTHSLQKFKNVLDGFARTCFEGKIVVDQIAQQTQAYQLNPNLVLSDRALVVSRPNLEISADDVKASHGSTTGQVDPDDLFYLKTRGLNENEAKKLLIYGFCKEIIDEILLPSVHQEAVSLVS